MSRFTEWERGTHLIDFHSIVTNNWQDIDRISTIMKYYIILNSVPLIKPALVLNFYGCKKVGPTQKICKRPYTRHCWSWIYCLNLRLPAHPVCPKLVLRLMSPSSVVRHVGQKAGDPVCAELVLGLASTDVQMRLVLCLRRPHASEWSQKPKYAQIPTKVRSPGLHLCTHIMPADLAYDHKVLLDPWPQPGSHNLTSCLPKGTTHVEANDVTSEPCIVHVLRCP